jgi:hypothetical protein
MEDTKLRREEEEGREGEQLSICTSCLSALGTAPGLAEAVGAFGAGLRHTSPPLVGSLC